MNDTQAIRQAVGRAGLNGSIIEKMRIMSRTSFSRKVKEPNKFTLGEIRMLDKKVHFTDEEIATLVRSKK